MEDMPPLGISWLRAWWVLIGWSRCMKTTIDNWNRAFKRGNKETATESR
jgi:hypothetical protein